MYGIAYSPTGKTSVQQRFGEDGRKYFTVEITQTAVDPAVPAEHEWSLDVPGVITILEHIVEVTDDAIGAVTRVDPELGVASGWTASTVDERLSWDWGADTPGLFASSFEARALSVPGGILFGRSKPDAAGGAVKTRITFVAGALL